MDCEIVLPAWLNHHSSADVVVTSGLISPVESEPTETLRVPVREEFPL